MSEPVAESGIVLELAEEFVERYRRGERPSLNEYAARYPELADEIREVFPAMAMMENIAPAEDSQDDPSLPRSPADELDGFDQLGDFRIIREVGRGGMGVVYEAEQLSLGRHVALKVLPPTVSDRRRHRFEREARAAARLHHTNIVPVFGVGEFRGMQYYVMQFIQGLGLNDVLDELRRMQAADGTVSGTPAAGDLRVSRRSDVSVQEIARTLMSGEFEGRSPGQPPAYTGRSHGVLVLGGLTHANSPSGAARQTAYPEAPLDPASPVSRPASAAEPQPTVSVDPPTPSSPPASDRDVRRSTSGGRLADTFSLSGSTVLTAGSGIAAGGGRRALRRRTYWHSVAHIGRQVADALEHAHEQGVLHRDIKPGNLLLDTRGAVWITDFGLAKADDQRDITQTGDVLGTLRYMPPEAFDGRSDARGDVYSLGLTLYELAALRPAFDMKDRHQLIRELTSGEPVRLEKLKPDVPRDLATIVHKSIDRDPLRRYQTARELADDLGRFLEDEPIRARPLSVTERLGRWCRHKPALAALTAVVVLLLVGVAIVSTLSAIRISDSRDDALRAKHDALQAKHKEALQRGQAERSAEESRRRLVDAHVASGMRLVEQGDLHGALPWLAEALRLDEHDDARAENHRLRLAAALDRSAKLVALWRAGEGAHRIEFCPDGRHIATSGAGNWKSVFPVFGEGRRGEATGARGIEIRDIATGRRTLLIAPESAVRDFTFSPDGTRVATAGQDGSARVWDVATGAPVTPVLRHEGPVNSVRFDAEGRRIATASDDKTARVWDAVSGESQSLPHDTPLDSAVFSPDGSRLLASTQGDLQLWDLATGRPALPLLIAEFSHNPIEIAFSADGRRIVCAGGHRAVRTWDAASGEVVSQIGEGYLSHLSADARRVASYIPAVQVWDVDTGEQLTPPLAELRYCTALAFNSLGERLLTGSWDGSVRIWDVATSRTIAGPLFHGTAVKSAAFSPDGRLTATLTRDGIVRVWDLAGTAHHFSPKQDEWISFVDFSPDGRWLVVDRADGIGCAWLADLSTGRVVRMLPGSKGLVCASFNPRHPAHVVMVFHDGTARIWDAATGNPITDPLRHSGLPSRAVFGPDDHLKSTPLIAHAEFSPDGQRLVTAGEDKTVRVWDAATGRLITELAHDRAVVTAHYSPDGRRLLTVTADALQPWDYLGPALLPIGACETHVRDVATGRPLMPPIRHSGTVLRAAFSPNGDAFMTIALSQVLVDVNPSHANRGEVQVWQTASGRPLGPALVHPQEVVEAAISPDGRLLATGTLEGTIRVWEIATGQTLSTFGGHAGMVTRVAFSSDGRRLLSASLDGMVRLCEPETGQAIAVFPHEQGAFRAAFVARGELLMTGCPDASVHFWPLGPDRRSASDWGVLADLLAVGRGVASTRTRNATDPIDAWLTARSKHQRDFAATIDEQRAWHRQALDEASSGKSWQVALVHLDRLLALDPDNLEERLDRARLLARLERWDEAEAEFTRAVERHPTAATAWAARGSVLLARGRRDEAAADFVRIIEHNQASGLDAAMSEFWVAGPYAEPLRTSQPPEKQLDATQPIPPAANAAGEGSGELRWRAASVDPSGYLDLAACFDHAEHISAYALAYIYARTDQDVAIWTGSDDQLRVWLNGELLHEHPLPRPPLPDQERTPAKLHAGWNTVLAKVVNMAGRHGLYLRLSADPADVAAAYLDRSQWNAAIEHLGRAIEAQQGQPCEAGLRAQRGAVHARLGHWQQAFEDYSRTRQLAPDDHTLWHRGAAVRLSMGDIEGYRQDCREMLGRFGDTRDPIIAERLAKNCTLLPGLVDEPQVLLKLADRAVTGTEYSDLHPYFQYVKGVAEYRAGHFEQAIPWLQQSAERITMPPCKAMAQLFLAMAFQRLGRLDEARAAFEPAEQVIKTAPQEGTPDWGPVWHDWIRCRAVYTEAAAMFQQE